MLGCHTFIRMYVCLLRHALECKILHESVFYEPTASEIQPMSRLTMLDLLLSTVYIVYTRMSKQKGGGY